MSLVPCYLIFFFAVLFSLKQAASKQVVIGAVIDNRSRAGMETDVSLQLALEDISRKTNQTFVLHVVNSQGEPATAALAGIICLEYTKSLD